MFRLDGKHALITGAGSGIGKTCANIFARQGASVMLTDIDEQNLKRTCEQINGEGNKADFEVADISDNVSCERVLTKMMLKMGCIDILVNSAGVTPRYAPEDWDFERTWDWVIKINLKGSMLMSKYAVEHMKQSGAGSIINMASIIGLVGYVEGFSDGFNPYPHSKGGVIQMTRDMAVALAKDGIRVNALCPGFSYTALTESLTQNPKILKKLEKLHPMGRLGQPEETAYAALFLASDEASFITGVSLPVDGGYTAQ